MSYSTIYSISDAGRCTELLELRNSHGSAPVIWQKMSEKYFGTTGAYGGVGGGWMERIDDLFEIAKKPSTSIVDRALIWMTADLAIIEKEHFSKAAADIRQFLKDFTFDPQYVNHWPRIAEFYDSKPKVRRIGIQHTSVSENPFEGPWNEKKERYDPIRPSKMFPLYREIEARVSQ